MPTNDEYLQQWENSAPTAVAGSMTQEEILKAQGTRKSADSPWASYMDDLDAELSPDLEAAIAEYSGRDPHGRTDSQTAEELARLREENTAAAQEYAWLSPDEYADQGARVGRIIHSSELIQIFIEQCGLTAMYRPHPQPKKLTLLVDTSHGQELPEVACWVQAGFMPEFSCCRFDNHGVILDESHRGWRTVLMQMVLKRMLTQEQVEQVFGPATGPASERYNAFMFSLRRQECGVYDVP